MLGLFKARSPLPLDKKVWAECRFRDLCEYLGTTGLRNVDVLVPDHPDLPQEYHASGNCILDVFDFVCERMGVPATDVEVSLFPADANTLANATYVAPQDGQLAQVLVADDLPNDPARLLAVLARTVAYEVVRTRCEKIWGTDDLEIFVEIIPMFFGFGVFMANTTLRESNYSDALMIQWSVSRSGNLSAEVHGYLGALFAWVRDEPAPQWARTLRLDAKDTLKVGLRYLYKTDDAVFDRNLLGVVGGERGVYDLQTQLRSASNSQKFSALIDAQTDGDAVARFETEIRSLAKSRDARLRALTIQTLGCLPSLTSPTLEVVVSATDDSEVLVRRSAAECLRPGSSDDALVKQVLTGILADRSRGVASAGALSLAKFEGLSNVTEHQGISLLKRGLAAQDEFTVYASLQLLATTVADWEDLIDNLDDPSWQFEVREHLQDLDSKSGSPTEPNDQRPLNFGASRIL
jgi:hypothetical protein